MFPLWGLWELRIAPTRDAGSCGAGEGVSSPSLRSLLKTVPEVNFDQCRTDNRGLKMPPAAFPLAGEQLLLGSRHANQISYLHHRRAFSWRGERQRGAGAGFIFGLRRAGCAAHAPGPRVPA